MIYVILFPSIDNIKSQSEYKGEAILTEQFGTNVLDCLVGLGQCTKGQAMLLFLQERHNVSDRNM